MKSKRCLAFIRVDGYEDAWMPCGNLATQGLFCAMHHEQIEGITLGLLSIEEDERNIPIKPRNNGILAKRVQ